MIMNNDNKKVAVVMSVYDGEKSEYLDLSLASILNAQTYKSIDLYLSIDGPIRDQLKNIITKYKPNKNLKIYENDKREGLSVNLNNILIDIVEEYEYIARMDTDDISFPTRIEKQVQFLENNKDIHLLGTGFIEIGESGEKQKLVKNPRSHEEIKKYFGVRNPISHPTVMFRASFFDLARFYPVTYREWYPVALPVEDTLFWIKAIKSGARFANLQEPLLYFRATTRLLQRRGGLKMSLLEYSIRKKSIREFNLSKFYYLFSVLNLFARLLPVSFKKILWKIRQ